MRLGLLAAMFAVFVGQVAAVLHECPRNSSNVFEFTLPRPRAERSRRFLRSTTPSRCPTQHNDRFDVQNDMVPPNLAAVADANHATILGSCN